MHNGLNLLMSKYQTEVTVSCISWCKRIRMYYFLDKYPNKSRLLGELRIPLPSPPQCEHVNTITLFYDAHFYHPQRSCGKVMFLHLSVILFTVGGWLPKCILGYTHAWVDTPWARHPLGRHLLADTLQQTPPADTPWQTPPGRHPLGRHPLGRHPPGQILSLADTLPWQTPPGHTLPWQTPPGQTPPCPVHAGRYTWLLLRTVRILLECILVSAAATTVSIAIAIMNRYWTHSRRQQQRHKKNVFQ